jgi:hypothetical protein
VSVEALVYSLPILVVVTLLKLLAMKTMPALRDTPLIDIRGVYAFGLHEFNLWLYIVLVVTYIVTAPAQEFFARSGLQASLDMLVPSEAKTNWTAIARRRLRLPCRDRSLDLLRLEFSNRAKRPLTRTFV